MFFIKYFKYKIVMIFRYECRFQESWRFSFAIIYVICINMYIKMYGFIYTYMYTYVGSIRTVRLMITQL